MIVAIYATQEEIRSRYASLSMLVHAAAKSFSVVQHDVAERAGPLQRHDKL